MKELLSEKYTFLRFLKTKSEEVLSSYKFTLNCLKRIVPVKDTATIKKGEITHWPGRLMFPEQILGLQQNESLWLVYVLRNKVETTELRNPYISKCPLPMYRLEYQTKVFDKDELMNIDDLTDTTYDYYLQANQHSGLLCSTGIGAFTINRFYCTFYDRDSAMVYAESLDSALNEQTFDHTVDK